MNDTNLETRIELTKAMARYLLDQDFFQEAGYDEAGLSDGSVDMDRTLIEDLSYLGFPESSI